MTAPPGGDTNGWPARLARQHSNELGLLAAIVVVVGITTVFSDAYREKPLQNAQEILRQTALLGVFSLGAAIVIISGGIDLSSGSVIAFSGSVCAAIMLALAPVDDAGNPMTQNLGSGVFAIAIGGTLLTGFLIGTLHAWLITVVGLPPFVATLASLVGLRSLAQFFVQEVTSSLTVTGKTTQIYVNDESFSRLGATWWIPLGIFLVLSFLAWVLMSRTVVGRHLVAMGGNEAAARLSGIRTDRLKWLAYCLGAMTASIAGILYTAEVGTANPQVQGRGYELNAIAAAVVGGCSLQGGIGLVSGTLLGVLFLRVVIDSVAKMVKVGADDYEGIIVGFLVVLAVAFNELRQARGSGGKQFFPGLLGVTVMVVLALLSGLLTTILVGKNAGGVVFLIALVGLALIGFTERRRRATLRGLRFSVAMIASPLISIRRVSKHYPGVLALEDISLDVVPGELLAIVGENGAGKSTLMKILSGVITDYEGEITLGGRPVRFGGTRDAEHSGISIIHQELNLVEQLSAAANIFLGRELRTPIGFLDQAVMDRRAAELLRQLECQIDPRAAVRQLRVGDQQLIEIAKALSLATGILIMDEPTSALTESEVARLFRVIGRLRSRGVTVLYISHKLDEVFRLADRIAVLRDGRLVDVLDRRQTDARAVTHLMVGREIEETDLSSPRQPGETVLEVEHLWLPWPGHAWGWRLGDVSFSLKRGEILGIAGLMGAGRTELLECLFGASADQPAGRIRVDGRNVSFQHPAEAREAGIALVTEDRKRLGLFAHLSVGQNITLCTLEKSLRQGLLSRRRENQRAEAVIAQLDVKTSGVDAPITSLSGGNQQKAIIGRWLLTDPKILLLDDPTRGIDVGAKAELYRLMDQLCRQGLGIIITSSELPELLALCDRILVLCEGRQTGEFSRAEATEQRIMEAATMRRTTAAARSA